MLLCVFFDLTNQVCKYFEFLCKTYLVFENLKGECFENLNFGKTGFKTSVLEKHFISYSCILFLIFNALRSFFQKPVFLFFKNSIFLEFRLIQSVFRSIEIAFKILSEPLSISINRKSRIRDRKSVV